MAIQLTLYPQNYEGYVTTTGAISLNELADASVFVTAITPGSTTHATNVPHTALNTNPPNANWQMFHLGAFNFPFTVINLWTSPIQLYLTFYGGNGLPNTSGCYQKLDNLVIGQEYEVVLDVAVPQPHNSKLNLMYFGIPNAASVTTTPVCGGPSQPPLLIDTTSSGQTTPVYFTAQNTSETFCLFFVSTGSDVFANGEVLCISEIIVRKRTLELNTDGQKIADLYNEQNIPLTLSIDNFQNASEKQQSYSKAFKLPATKHNNEIFENLFELTRNSLRTPAFNPYKQTRAVYKEDGHVIFSGFMRLIDVQKKDGEFSYNVNLYSEAVALATLMKAEKMSEIDLNELTHNYNKSVISNSWAGSLNLLNDLAPDSFAKSGASLSHTNVVKYPNCNWNGQIMEEVSNTIYASSGNTANLNQPAIPNLQTMFRPWIKLRYLINKIFHKHGYTYTSNFFDSAYFGRLFMDFNWGKEINWTERIQVGAVDHSSGAPAQNFAFNSTGTVILADNNTFLTAGYDTSTGIFTAPGGGMTYNITAEITMKNNSSAACTGIMFFQHTANATSTTTIISQQNLTIGANSNRTFTLNIDATTTFAIYDTLQIRFIPIQAACASNCNCTLQETSNMQGSVAGSTIVGGTLMNTARGKMKQWDFFKGIVTMFNLVTLQDPKNPKNLIIEPYNDVFGRSNTQIVTHDWTDKIDDSELKFKPMDLKRTTMFQYQEDTDYPFGVYKSATNGYLYGSLEYTLPDYTQVKGVAKVEAKPFASTIVKPFFASIPDWVGPNIYKANADETKFEGIENKPRILYDVTGDTGSAMNPTGDGTPMPTGVTFYVPYQNGSSGSNFSHTCIFSHVDAYPATFGDRDLNFGPCQLIGIGVPPVDNLYSRFYADYYYELTHPDTKSVKLKILLTPTEISNFEFWDKVRIKNRIYRVSKINYKPRQLSEVELILIP